MDQGVVVIEAGSEAFKELAEALAHPDTRKVSIQVREDGLAVKTNEYGWTLGLEIQRR